MPTAAHEATQLRQGLRTLTDFLLTLPLEELARQAGFCRRRARKLSPLLFLQATVLLLSQGAVSLRRWAILVGLLGELTLSKQALWERLTARAVAFLQAVLAACIGRVAQPPTRALPAALRHFGRVLLQDSTTLKLCVQLAAFFPGSANQRGAKSGQLKIQSIYDLVSQRFVAFGLSGFRRNDQAAAGDVLEVLRTGDLVLRDLGYFVVKSLEQIQQAGAFFLSRLRLDTSLWETDGQKPLDLLKELRHHGQLDLEVRLGLEHKLAVRLVAVKLPAAVAAERRRRDRQNRDRRCQPNARHLALLDWAIFITNVPREKMSARTVAQVYGLRWRVETIFKAWKSHFRLTQVPCGGAAALEAMIYARLIFVTVFARSCGQGWLGPWREESPPPRSLLKVAALVGDYVLVLCLQAWGKDILRSWILQLGYHTSYERRTRIPFPEKLMKLS